MCVFLLYNIYMLLFDVMQKNNGISHMLFVIRLLICSLMQYFNIDI